MHHHASRRVGRSRNSDMHKVRLSRGSEYSDQDLILPEWIDLLVVAAFSLVIYYLAVASTLSTSMVATLVEAEAQEAAVAPTLSVAG